MLEYILYGLIQSFTWMNLLAMVVGMAVGLVVGAMPGLSITMGITLLIPMTFGMPPATAILMLVGVYCAGTYAGSISAILIKTPGTAAAACTVIDGYAMSQKGQSKLALNLALYASVFGGLFSGVTLLLFAPQIAKAALKFGPPEYFMLAVFGLTIIASVSGKSILKGLIMASIGLLASTIGIDPIQGVYRLTFGSGILAKGVSLVPALIGLFAISELFAQMEKGHHKVSNIAEIKGDKKFGFKDLFKYKAILLKSSIIGVIVGAIPGTGAAIASFMSYREAKRTSKNPELFGNGSPEGIVASESANNGVTGATMIPMMTLGIPGDVITAVLMGALMMQGMSPGPLLFTQQGKTVYTIIVGFFIVNIGMLFMGKLAIRAFGNICKIPYSILLPVVLGFCLVGSYSCSNSMADVLIALAFGVIGYILPKFGFPTTPALIALVLGPIAEQALVQSMVISDGSPTIFFTRPLSLVFFLLAAVSVYYSLKQKHGGKKKVKID